jgi:BASS family bile acid:Na+ symporter
MLNRLTSLFPLWALLATAVGYAFPAAVAGASSAIVPLLTVIMFGMGITLRWADFRRVAEAPKIVFVGVLLQFSVMPLAAFLIARALDFQEELVVGMVLVGSAPGGTASNVVCFLANANVALSITLTTVSTLAAVLATPFLSWLYVGESVPVPVWSMLLSVLQIVLLPVIAGTLINSFWGARLRPYQPIFPALSVISIVVIIAIVVALNQARLEQIAILVMLGVVLHNLSGLLLGYAIPRLLGYDRRTARTLAIEIGMQNSGLAVALALKYFSPVAALPGAVFSIWHNLSGSVLAGYWRGRRGLSDKKAVVSCDAK